MKYHTVQFQRRIGEPGREVVAISTLIKAAGSSSPHRLIGSRPGLRLLDGDQGLFLLPKHLAKCLGTELIFLVILINFWSFSQLQAQF